MYPLGATSSARRATRSQQLSLLSIARLNMARSRVRRSNCNMARMDHTCAGRNGGFGPASLPLFQTGRRGLGLDGDCFLNGRSPGQETVQLAIRREQPADLASASEPDLSWHSYSRRSSTSELNSTDLKVAPIALQQSLERLADMVVVSGVATEVPCPFPGAGHLAYRCTRPKRQSPWTRG